MRHYHNKQEADANIDLTPMLDVVFIMLIFFIITATFIKEATLVFDRPDNTNQQENNQKTENILIEVHSDNQLMIDKLQIDKRALRAYFQRHQAKHPDAIVIIRAHNKSKTATLTTIADAANAAGIKAVSLDTIEHFKEE